MKKLFTLLAVVFLAANVFAQSPQKMSYQAVIRNNSNVLVTSTAIGMRVSILQGSGTGTEVYKEIYNPNPQTNANGLVTIEIGGGIPLTGTFASINWANGPYFIKTETDPTGGTNYTIIGTSQLLSVPYALHARTADSLTGSGITHNIGDSYGGGIVFYVYDNGRHGLIAATADQSTSTVWTTSTYQSTVSNAVRDGVNGGQTNTERIIIQAGAGSYAAQLCANYNGGNFADWYLPSKYELNLLYLQKNLVGANNYVYWSSTEYGNTTTYAWYQYFDNGAQDGHNKGDPACVRAVRAF